MPKYASYPSSAPCLRTDKFQIVRAGADGTLTIADVFQSSVLTGTATVNASGAIAARGGLLGIVKDLSGATDSFGFCLQSAAGSSGYILFGGPSSSLGYSFFQSYKEGTGSGAKAIALNPLGGFVSIGSVTPAHALHLGTDDAAKPSTNTWTISSDARLKQNIVPADLARCYEIVKAVPLKRFTWKGEVYSPEQVADRSKLGFIADDVEPVFPKAVSRGEFSLQPVEDGTEEVEEHVVVDEERIVEYVEVVEGRAILHRETETVAVPQFDELPVLDETGAAVFDSVMLPGPDGQAVETPVPRTLRVPRMRAVTRPKMRVDTIPDCLALNSDQMFAALYGAVQRLQQKVEALEAQIAAKG